MPEHEIRARLTSWEITKLIAADRQGLLPDPQLQTARICAVLANQWRSKEDKAISEEDCLRKVIELRAATAEQLEEGRKQRRQIWGK